MTVGPPSEPSPASSEAVEPGQLERVGAVPGGLEERLQRGDEPAALEQHRAGLPGRRERQWHQRQVGIGDHELDRKLVGDPQLEPAP